MRYLLFVAVGVTVSLMFLKLLQADSKLKAGEDAPKFSLPANDGKTYALDDLKGSWVVLYFYPKDETPGCTKEACAFRDRNKEIEAAGAKVFGINTDSVASHQAFVKKYNLTFPLLSDTGGKVGRSYGVMGPIGFARRNTFLIDDNGKIAKVYLDVKVGEHADEILKDLAVLKMKK